MWLMQTDGICINIVKKNQLAEWAATSTTLDAILLRSILIDLDWHKLLAFYNIFEYSFSFQPKVVYWLWTSELWTSIYAILQLSN